MPLAQSGSLSYHELSAPSSCFQTLPFQEVVSTMSLIVIHSDQCEDLNIGKHEVSCSHVDVL